MELRSVVAGKRSYSPDDVLFAFISGGLDYDCACCGAKCCRGFGYALDGDQALHQLERRPHLRYFVEYKNGRTLAKNLPPACFFLTDSGRCEIQEGVREDFSAAPWERRDN